MNNNDNNTNIFMLMMFHPHSLLSVFVPPCLSLCLSLFVPHSVIVCSFCDDIWSDVESHQRSSLRPQKPPEWTSGMNHIIFSHLYISMHSSIDPFFFQLLFIHSNCVLSFSLLIGLLLSCHLFSNLLLPFLPCLQS